MLKKWLCLLRGKKEFDKLWSYGDFNKDRFLGEVKGEGFITFEELIGLVVLTKGKSLNNESTWLKFLINVDYVDDVEHYKEIYIAKTPILYGISWDDLCKKQLVSTNLDFCGKREICINGTYYHVRLLKGLNTLYQESCDKTYYSEWDRTICKLLISEKSFSNIQQHYNYKDLGIVHEDYLGCYNWCQETSKEDINLKLVRGFRTPDSKSLIDKTLRYSFYGWRPVLEKCVK